MKERCILLVDDDPDDLELFQDVFLELDSELTILKANDGIEAMDKLEELHSNFALPSLIILDVNMPRMDGRETVCSIKSIEQYKTVPVVVFSTSSNEVDRRFFLKREVEFITKPLNLESLLKVARNLMAYLKI